MLEAVFCKDGVLRQYIHRHRFSNLAFIAHYWRSGYSYYQLESLA